MVHDNQFRTRQPRRALAAVTALLLGGVAAVGGVASPPPGSQAAPAPRRPPGRTADVPVPSQPPEPGAFNVVEEAVLDPATGAVTLVGHWDGRFHGPTLPYRQVLAEAMESPGPQFSLDSDFSRFTRETLLGRSLSDLLFTRDGELTPFASVLLRILQVPPPAGEDLPAVTAVGAAVLRQAGFSLAAELREALPASGGPTSLTLQRWIESLGLVAEFQQFQEERRDPARATDAADRFWPLLVEGLAESLGPEGGRVPDRYHAARDRGGDPDAAIREAVVAFAAGYDPLLVRALEILLERHGMAAVVLSSADLQEAFSVTPVSHPVFRQLAPGTQLARSLFEGDVALKSIPFDTRLLAVDRYRTFPDWAEAYIDTAELGAARDTRYWITVERVDLGESADGNRARVGSVRLRVESRSKAADEPWSAERPDPRSQAYADLLTENLDAIAEHVPELQRLRESAKVVALANWLLGNEGVARPADPPEPWTAPEEVSGFLAMMPYVRTGLPVWGVWPSGGVDFDFRNRIVITKDPALDAEPAPPAADPGDARRSERLESLLRPVSPPEALSPEGTAGFFRLGADMMEARRTARLSADLDAAWDRVAVLDRYLSETQALQATSLRDAAQNLGRAADLLPSLEPAMAAAGTASSDGPALQAAAREFQEAVAELSIARGTAFDPGRLRAVEAVLSSESLRRLQEGIDAALAGLARDAPEGRDAFQRAASRGRTSLDLVRQHTENLHRLLPHLSSIRDTHLALDAILDDLLDRIESARNAAGV